MAKVTTVKSETTFVLELTEAEAQYVEASLYNSSPAHLVEDAPWDALNGAMVAAGVDVDRSACAPPRY